MNRAQADPIADAVLYEGYILYPYRPSTKNRQRWTFGGLYPESYFRSGRGDAWVQQTECLVVGDAATAVEIVVRFLHLTARQVGAIDRPLAEWPGEGFAAFRPIESLRVNDRLFQTWQEAEAREVSLDAVTLDELRAGPVRRSFAFPGGVRLEPLVQGLRGGSEAGWLGSREQAPSHPEVRPGDTNLKSDRMGRDGTVVGVLSREQQGIQGLVEVSATEAGEGLFRLTVRVLNTTVLDAGPISRDDALLRALVSTHAILGVERGEFISLIDPPEPYREAASECRNIGAWPVLVGEEGRADMMLASPIILYDYPKIAPESAGDLFDGTEIDEILTLRIMTLTDAEKDAMTAVDARANDLLARTEALAREQMMGLHGTFRGLRPLAGEGAHG